ncbi:MAG TPA: DUF2059 domain-containing protein [Thermoanaerobaculia bacterium]|jgi:hypothetical protein
MRNKLAVALLLVVSLPLLAGTTEPNPSTKQRALVEKLLVLMNLGENGTAMMDTMLAQMQKQLLEQAQAKGGSARDLAEAKELFDDFRKNVSAIDFNAATHEAFIRIYSKYFSESDLEALVAFYGSPVGQKTVAVMNDLMRESMEAGNVELGPKIEAAYHDALEQQEKKHPWRKTMANMRSVGVALEAYASDHDDLYPEGDYSSLEETLEEYVDDFAAKDVWGHAYAYAVSTDRKHYRIVSSGADGIFEWDSRTPGAVKEGSETRYLERLDADIVFGDGAFLQAPSQSKEQ